MFDHVRDNQAPYLRSIQETYPRLDIDSVRLDFVRTFNGSDVHHDDPAMIPGDFGGDILIEAARISGAIDFTPAGPGNPAVDLKAALDGIRNRDRHENAAISMNSCPECGAQGNKCQARFEEYLVLEFTDPDYGVVHHLTVATFMLQHSSRMTGEGWLHERELLREFLVENKPPAYIRRQNKDLVDSGKRTFRFKSMDGKPVIRKTTWMKTILDVSAEKAEVYCSDITAWAFATLEEAYIVELETTKNEIK